MFADLEWFLLWVSQTNSIWTIFSETQKFGKYAKNRMEDSFPPQMRQRHDVIGWIPILSDSFEFWKHFSAQKFFSKPENSESTPKTIRLATPPPQKGQEWGDWMDPDLGY